MDIQQEIINAFAPTPVAEDVITTLSEYVLDHWVDEFNEGLVTGREVIEKAVYNFSFHPDCKRS